MLRDASCPAATVALETRRNWAAHDDRYAVQGIHGQRMPFQMENSF